MAGETRRANLTEEAAELGFAAPEPPTAPPWPPYSAFSQAQKTVVLAIVTCAAISTFLSLNIYLPLLPTLTRDLKVSISMINLTVTFFMLVFACAPFLYARIADAKGRKPALALGLVVYSTANIGLAAAPARFSAFMVLRVVQGLGASALYSVGAGCIADAFEPDRRARAIAVFSLGPQLGPVIGPSVGGAITHQEGWRWTFGFLSIIGGFCLLLVLLLLPETLMTRVNRAEARRWIQWPPFQRKVRSSLPPTGRSERRRQVILKLLKHPIAMISTVNTAIVFGSYYSAVVSYPTLLERKYGFNTVEIGLAYLAPGCAMICGSLGLGHFSDRARKRLLRQTGTADVEPETRIRLQVVGIAVLPVGALLYAWLGNSGIHAAGSIVGISLCAFGLSWTVSTNTTYLTLLQPQHAATAVALSAFMMNASAAIGTGIIAPLIKAEGFGWCFTGVAVVDLVCVGLAVLAIAKERSWTENLSGARGLRSQEDAEPRGAQSTTFELGRTGV